MNYTKVIADPNHVTFECHCEAYSTKFIGTNHNHIVTGDMNIVSNVSLRTL